MRSNVIVAARLQPSICHARTQRETTFSIESSPTMRPGPHSYDPELKRQSSEWLEPGSPRPKKCRRGQGGTKVMHVTFFDHEDIIFDETVPKGQRVTGQYYLTVLKKVRRAIEKKRPHLYERGVSLPSEQRAATPHGRGARIIERVAGGKCWTIPTRLAGPVAMRLLSVPAGEGQPQGSAVCQRRGGQRGVQVLS